MNYMSLGRVTLLPHLLERDRRVQTNGRIIRLMRRGHGTSALMGSQTRIIPFHARRVVVMMLAIFCRICLLLINPLVALFRAEYLSVIVVHETVIYRPLSTSRDYYFII